jgi:hypothetical protein
MEAYDQVRTLRAQIAALLPAAQGTVATGLRHIDEQAAALEGARRGRGNRDGAANDNAPKGFGDLQGSFATLFTVLEEADLPPTTQATTALHATERSEQAAEAGLARLRKDLPAINTLLQAAGMSTLELSGK